MTAHRDVFIDRLFDKAVDDKTIRLVAVDMGAPSLDRWRRDLPDQFVYGGISEQNSINISAGMSSEGCKVYVYYMGCWSMRCLEQMKYSCSMADNPITIVGNGIGLGYAPAGPAHEPTEDITYLKSVYGIEIITPSNEPMVESVVDLTYDTPRLRCIRIERTSSPEVEGLFPRTHPISQSSLDRGMAVIENGLSESITQGAKPKIGIVSMGYMLGRGLECQRSLLAKGYEASVIDLWRIKPINAEVLRETITPYDVIVTLEEHILSGGFGASICEAVCDMGLSKRILRIGLPERYVFENGTRDYLLDMNGLSTKDICLKIEGFIDGVAHDTKSSVAYSG